MEFEAKRKSAKAQHRKELLDPLLDMQHYVETKKKSEGLSGKGSECESRRHSNPVQVIPQTVNEFKSSYFNGHNTVWLLLCVQRKGVSVGVLLPNDCQVHVVLTYCICLLYHTL